MNVGTILLATVGASLIFAATTFPLPSENVFHILNGAVLATGVFVFYTYWPGLVDLFKVAFRKLPPEETLCDLVEDQLSEQMIVHARIAAHYVAAAEKCGTPPEEINKRLKQITDTTILDEFWITDEKGDAYLTNTGIPFAFNKSNVLQPQAYSFWPLLMDETDQVTQRARKREIDDKWFKYAGVNGVDKPRIVQVGFGWPFVERLRKTFGVGPGLSAGHILTLGVVTNWAGFSMRLARWYLTGTHPPVEDLQLWFYNIGLWLSILAGWLLIGAVAANSWNNDKWIKVLSIWAMITISLIMFNFFIEGSLIDAALP